MRIIIEIDGDNVAVHTDRQLSETDTAKVVDAGSAPVELLRQYGGEGMYETSDVAQSPKGKRAAVKPRKDIPLNPLRAGEAIARRMMKSGNESESDEIIDAGQAPGLPKVCGRKARRSSLAEGRADVAGNAGRIGGEVRRLRNADAFTGPRRRHAATSRGSSARTGRIT